MSPFLRLWTNARHASATRQAAAKRRPRARFRPHLEPLEDRLAPATLTWTGAAGNFLWSDPRNWAEGTTPYDYNNVYDLIFPLNPQPGHYGGLSVHDDPDLPFQRHRPLISSITFLGPDYIIAGGDLTFVGNGVIASRTFGTNTFLSSSISIESMNEVHFIVDENDTLVVNSTIVGDGIVHASLDGELDLRGDNRYMGGTVVDGSSDGLGRLVVESHIGVGTGTLQLYSGRLESATPVEMDNPIEVIGPSSIGGSNGLQLNGSVQLNSTLTVAHTDGIVRFDGTVVGPGKLVKSGTGPMFLNASNSYAGGTEVSAGLLRLTNNNALGAGGLELKGGIVEATWLTPDQRAVPLTLANRFVVSGGTISSARDTFNLTGDGTLNGRLAVTDYVSVGAKITFSGALAGSGSLTTKDSRSHLFGMLVFSGTAANSYTGTTTVTDGKLVLSKPAGVTAIPGRLIIGVVSGDGVRFANAVVSLAAPNQIAATAPVTVNADGLLKLNNFSQKLGPVTGRGDIITADPPTLTVVFDDVSATFEGEISGPGTVVKDGTGTWVLSGANTYEGGTVVEGGTLLVDGSLTGPVTVDAGAMLGGAGSTGPVTLSPGAAVSPGGPAPGIQRVQDLAFSAGSSYVVQLNGPDPGTGYDQLDVTGTVSLNGATLDAALGFSPAPGDRFVIIQNDGTDPVTGTFAGLPQGASLWVGGAAFHIYYDGGDGNDVVLVRNVAPAVTVPGDQAAFQNVDLALGGIRVADPEDANLTVTLGVSHGTLTLGTVAGLTVGGNGTPSVRLSGSQAVLNAALAGLLYRPDHNFSGPDLLTVTTSDGLDTTSATVPIRVKSLAEQAADLQDLVNALRAAGALNPGQANSLIVKLDLKGNAGDVGRVQGFLNEVAAYLSAGILAPAQADELTAGGNVLLTGLRRR
jgi:autotransporter-associated beta strand protein